MSDLYTYPKIYNLTLTNANTEYSQILTPRHSYFEIKCRSLEDLKISFVATESGTNYITIPAGSIWFSKGKINGQVVIYVQSPIAGVVAEILEWIN